MHVAYRFVAHVTVLSLTVLMPGTGLAAGPQAPRTQTSGPAKPSAATPAMERLGPSLYRLGRIRVDAAKREISLPGVVNEVSTLEFIACTRNGMKAYESAISMDASAIEFNAALLLIGLDPARSRVPTRHFDPVPPAGDPVEILIEWPADGATPGGRGPIEVLLFNKRSNQTVPKSSWVYTGGTLMPNGRFLAERDGVLIGFVHSPSPLIENVGGIGVNDYGNIVLNTKHPVPYEAPITVIIRALTRDAPPR